MFLTSRVEFKNYLESTKKPFMANFYKINRSKTNILMNKNGTPKGGKWSFDEDNRKKLPDKIDIPKHLKFQNTSHTEDLKKFIEAKFKVIQGLLIIFGFRLLEIKPKNYLINFSKLK